ncbi:hypothetical protein [Paraburkholderia youngii]|uniref:Uncharacterized protein n=1 Tax=Paraburkholderia youngii TaxID=2782701 RepID=A0A7Y6KA02_9BURK|nr:hypothetical protein [Paraburkholderia youngii]NUY06113.1 hypothetical protein [Paraburkholderia youngii]
MLVGNVGAAAAALPTNSTAIMLNPVTYAVASWPVHVVQASSSDDGSSDESSSEDDCLVVADDDGLSVKICKSGEKSVRVDVDVTGDRMQRATKIEFTDGNPLGGPNSLIRHGAEQLGRLLPKSGVRHMEPPEGSAILSRPGHY